MTSISKKTPLIIFKIGGSIIDQPEALSHFLSDFSKLETLKILVHGGGRTADQLLTKMNIKPLYNEGRRITDDAALDIVIMAYGGLINGKIVAELQKYHCNAIGLSGADGGSILAVKRKSAGIDYGYAGDVTSTNADIIKYLINGQMVPVFCALTHDGKGQILNTNADTIAAELGIGLSNYFDVEIRFCFDNPGVFENMDDPGSIYKELTFREYQDGIAKGTLHGGVIPKLHNAFKAIKNGVSSVWITSTNQTGRTLSEGTKIIAGS